MGIFDSYSSRCGEIFTRNLLSIVLNNMAITFNIYFKYALRLICACFDTNTCRSGAMLAYKF
jgi:hypothetical protein